MSITLRQVPYEAVMDRIEAVIDISTRAFLQNHEITKEAYSSTEPQYKHHFRFLFEEHVSDMMQEIEKNKGLFFIAEDQEKKKIVAISVGRPYGTSALSKEFMQSVFVNKSNFKKVMHDWWKLMEKFQAVGSDTPPARIYHQAMTAVDPEYAGKGIGTKLSVFIMQKIDELGFDALARETSSTPAHRVIQHLQEQKMQVVDIDSVTNESTKIDLILRLQLTPKPQAQEALRWFLNKKEQEVIILSKYPELMTATHSLYTNDTAKRLFHALDALEGLKSSARHAVTRQQIERRILELNAIVQREINGPDEKGGTPLQGAAYARDVATLRRLIVAGADLDRPEPFYGGNVLHVAVEGGSKECIMHILLHAPHLAARSNKYGVTACKWAATKQNINSEYKEIFGMLSKIDALDTSY